jgi:hypothetical protein
MPRRRSPDPEVVQGNGARERVKHPTSELGTSSSDMDAFLAGHNLPSVRAAARHFGVSPGVVEARLRRSWSIPEAFGLALRERGRRDVAEFLAQHGFATSAAAARHFGVSRAAVATRLGLGWTVPEAFGLGGRDADHWTVTELLKKHDLPSLKAAGEHFGLSRGLIEARLRRGWTPSEAFGLTLRTGARPDVLAFLKQNNLSSIRAAAKHFDLPYSAVESRLKRGWSPREAFGLALREKWRPDVTEFLKEQNLRSVTEACRHFGLLRGTFESRVRRGWTAEEAFGVKRRDRRSEFLREHNLPSLRAAAKHFGLSHGIVYARLRRGWTLPEAFGIDIRHKRRYDVREFLNERNLRTISEACQKFGVKRSTFESRLRRGWTVRQIFALEPRLDDSRRADDERLE